MSESVRKQNQIQEGNSIAPAKSSNVTESTTDAHPILQLQRSLGNQAVQDLLGANRLIPEMLSKTAAATPFISEHNKTPGQIQPKLMVNTPGDAHEQEADRVSEQVLNMSDASGGVFPDSQPGQPGQGQESVQTSSVGSGGAGLTAAPPIVHEVLDSPGQPLSLATRAFMEPRFGHEFSRVRVHTDARAAASAQAVEAQAYAVGRDVVFGTGQYAPGTSEGKKLLAHELAHVVQQGRESASPAAIRRRPDSRKGPEQQLREKEARLAKLKQQIQALSDEYANLQQRRVAVDSERQRRANERAARTEARADAGGPVPTFALRMLRRAIRVEQTATTIRFVATMEITFQGLSETDGKARAGTEIPRIVQAIRDAWTVAFTEGAYKGVAFSIDPRITYRSPNTPPNPDAWQIEVRARDDKQGSTGTPWSGIISTNPVHLQGNRVRVIGHEVFHLFGQLLDTYMPPPEDVGGKAVSKPNVSVGRPDPKGRPDLVGLIDPVVLKRWLDKGYITQADFDRQAGTIPTVWQEDLEQILEGMGVMTPRQFQMEQIAQQTNRSVKEVLAAKSERNSMEWLKLAEESMQLEKEIASLRSQLGQQAPKKPQP